jgi:hypothetical protein
MHLRELFCDMFLFHMQVHIAFVYVILFHIRLASRFIHLDLAFIHLHLTARKWLPCRKLLPFSGKKLPPSHKDTKKHKEKFL